VEGLLNGYDPGSAVARVQAGGWVEVDPITAEAFRLAQVWGERTGGAFELTLGVTALAPTAAEADILSTALFVMGIDAGQAWLQANPMYGALFVMEDGEVILSAGLGARVEVTP